MNTAEADQITAALQSSGRGLAMIVAAAKNGVIGVDGDLPWSLPDDMRHFMRTTSGHPIIMGRATWDTMPKRLPNRTSIVLSRTPNAVKPLATGETPHSACASLAEAVEHAVSAPAATPWIFVIGGSFAYSLAEPFATRCDLTCVDAEPIGDTRFEPDISVQAGWTRVTADTRPQDERHNHAFVIERWERDLG